MDDETLVNECIDGNEKAQRLLFDRFSGKMLGVSMRYINDKEHAQDVLQDAFIKVFKNLKRFNKEGSFEGWIRRIVVNTALDELRKMKKRRNDIELDDSFVQVSFNNFTEERLQAESLLKLVQGLPDGYRTVFNLFAIEGYSHKEIAEKLNISENTSKSQYSRARTAMKEILKKLEIER
jgi:RNA polymerase sigma-70 factor (ECF subfamily)